MKRKKIASTILAALLTASTLTTTVSAAPINDTQNVIVESQGENDFVEEAATKKVGTVTNCSQLNLRAQSNANSKILAVLKKGQQVDVLDQLSNGWVKVKYNGKTGYVSGKYVKIGNVVKPPVNTISAARKKVLERAKEMVEVKWTSPITFLGWRAKASYTIKKGSTNTGIPYSQTVNQVRSGKEFKKSLSKMTYSYQRFGITMPRYGNDCSGFVSAALGISRKTTSTLPNCTVKISYNDYVKVGIADYKISANPNGLLTLGLGSCVGICLYDIKMQIGGLAHIMLPDSSEFKVLKGSENKYAAIAIPEMVKEM